MRILGRTIKHNMRALLAERKQKRGDVRPRGDYDVSARSRSGSR
jgi:hypothetical protein